MVKDQARLAAIEVSVSEKKERVEHNRLSESNRQNAVHDDGCERAGVAPHGCRHAQASESDANAGTHCGKSDVNASAHFCE
jgi:hypothetical protein